MTNDRAWKKLKYEGKEFNERFSISSYGDIRNDKTKNLLSGKWINNKYYVVISYEGKSYRIIVGKAQLESGLPRTIMNRINLNVNTTIKEDKRLKYAFTKVQMEALDNLVTEKVNDVLKKHKLL